MQYALLTWFHSLKKLIWFAIFNVYSSIIWLLFYTIINILMTTSFDELSLSLTRFCFRSCASVDWAQWKTKTQSANHIQALAVQGHAYITWSEDRYISLPRSCRNCKFFSPPTSLLLITNIRRSASCTFALHVFL